MERPPELLRNEREEWQTNCGACLPEVLESGVASANGKLPINTANTLQNDLGFWFHIRLAACYLVPLKKFAMCQDGNEKITSIQVSLNKDERPSWTENSHGVSAKR